MIPIEVTWCGGRSLSALDTWLLGQGVAAQRGYATLYPYAPALRFGDWEITMEGGGFAVQPVIPGPAYYASEPLGVLAVVKGLVRSA